MVCFDYQVFHIFSNCLGLLKLEIAQALLLCGMVELPAEYSVFNILCCIDCLLASSMIACFHNAFMYTRFALSTESGELFEML